MNSKDQPESNVQGNLEQESEVLRQNFEDGNGAPIQGNSNNLPAVQLIGQNNDTLSYSSVEKSSLYKYAQESSIESNFLSPNRTIDQQQKIFPDFKTLEKEADFNLDRLEGLDKAISQQLQKFESTKGRPNNNPMLQSAHISSSTHKLFQQGSSQTKLDQFQAPTTPFIPRKSSNYLDTLKVDTLFPSAMSHNKSPDLQRKANSIINKLGNGTKKIDQQQQLNNNTFSTFDEFQFRSVQNYGSDILQQFQYQQPQTERNHQSQQQQYFGTEGFQSNEQHFGKANNQFFGSPHSQHGVRFPAKNRTKQYYFGKKLYQNQEISSRYNSENRSSLNSNFDDILQSARSLISDIKGISTKGQNGSSVMTQTPNTQRMRHFQSIDGGEIIRESDLRQIYTASKQKEKLKMRNSNARVVLEESQQLINDLKQCFLTKNQPPQYHQKSNSQFQPSSSSYGRNIENQQNTNNRENIFNTAPDLSDNTTKVVLTQNIHDKGYLGNNYQRNSPEYGIQTPNQLKQDIGDNFYQQQQQQEQQQQLMNNNNKSNNSEEENCNSIEVDDNLNKIKQDSNNPIIETTLAMKSQSSDENIDKIEQINHLQEEQLGLEVVEEEHQNQQHDYYEEEIDEPPASINQQANEKESKQEKIGHVENFQESQGEYLPSEEKRVEQHDCHEQDYQELNEVMDEYFAQKEIKHSFKSKHQKKDQQFSLIPDQKNAPLNKNTQEGELEGGEFQIGEQSKENNFQSRDIDNEEDYYYQDQKQQQQQQEQNHKEKESQQQEQKGDDVFQITKGQQHQQQQQSSTLKSDIFKISKGSKQKNNQNTTQSIKKNTTSKIKVNTPPIQQKAQRTPQNVTNSNNKKIEVKEFDALKMVASSAAKKQRQELDPKKLPNTNKSTKNKIPQDLKEEPKNKGSVALQYVAPKQTKKLVMPKQS